MILPSLAWLRVKQSFVLIKGAILIFWKEAEDLGVKEIKLSDRGDVNKSSTSDGGRVKNITLP